MRPMFHQLERHYPKNEPRQVLYEELGWTDLVEWLPPVRPRLLLQREGNLGLWPLR